MEEQSTKEVSTKGNSWAWPVATVLIVIALVVGLAYAFRACMSMPGKVLDKTARLADKIGAARQ